MYELGSAHGRVIIDHNIQSAMQDAQRQFASGLLGMSQTLRDWGKSLSSLGQSITLATAPLAVMGTVGLKTASDFENAMLEISARTGTTGADLERVRDIAIDLGAKTVFSAQDAANALLLLLAAGQSTEEALSTLPAVLDGAAASGASLGETADVVTSVLAAFGLQAQDSADVVDVLARASAASKADMLSIGQGFANVGTVASQFGMSIEQTAAVLSIFANNGIAGAEAGTQLKSMLLNMNRLVQAVVTRIYVRLNSTM